MLHRRILPAGRAAAAKLTRLQECGTSYWLSYLCLHDVYITHDVGHDLQFLLMQALDCVRDVMWAGNLRCRAWCGMESDSAWPDVTGCWLRLPDLAAWSLGWGHRSDPGQISDYEL